MEARAAFEAWTVEVTTWKGPPLLLVEGSSDSVRVAWSDLRIKVAGTGIGLWIDGDHDVEKWWRTRASSAIFRGNAQDRGTTTEHAAMTEHTPNQAISDLLPDVLEAEPVHQIQRGELRADLPNLDPDRSRPRAGVRPTEQEQGTHRPASVARGPCTVKPLDWWFCLVLLVSYVVCGISSRVTITTTASGRVSSTS